MSDIEDFLPILVTATPSRRVQVIAYIGQSISTEVLLYWDDTGVRDALRYAEQHTDIGSGREAHIILTGTSTGIFIVRSHERTSQETRNLTESQRIIMLEASLRRQLMGKRS